MDQFQREGGEGEELLLLHAAQNVLKASAAARAVVVWRKVAAAGMPIDEASAETWGWLEQHLIDSSEDSPISVVRSRLELPSSIGRAVEVAGKLAAASYQFMEHHEMTAIPMPGVTSGEISRVPIDEIPLAMH
jgi:hypothetical protein